MIDTAAADNGRVDYMTCWSATTETVLQTGQVWRHPTGSAHAFGMGQLTALCGAARVFDNGLDWPPGGRDCCAECIALTAAD